MKTTQQRNPRSGFTLIEMVGVLAVIAILAALLVPKIFAAINESRIASAVTACNTAKGAAISYFGKYGLFGDDTGTAYPSTVLPVNTWGTAVLYKLGYLDKPITSRVGSGAEVILEAALGENVDPTTTNAAFELDSDTSTKNDASAGNTVVLVKFTGVDAEDAQEVNFRIDGNNNTGWETNGRVKYDATTKALLVYLVHK